MASTKTKTAKKDGLMSIPAHEIILTFVSKLKKSFIDTLVDGVKLPNEVRNVFGLTRLKGFQHSIEFQELLNDKVLSAYYETSHMFIQSRGGTEIKTSLSTLTDGHKLYNFMLTNAVKLYLQPHESQTGIIRDRNYSEICGQSQHEDVKNSHKAYINSTMTKSIKTDIKEVKVMVAMIVERDIVHTPGRKVRTEMEKLFSPEAIAKWKEAKKLEAATTKMIANK
jgi:hypothetical protein